MAHVLRMAAALAVTAGLAIATAGAHAGTTASVEQYIVRLADPPLASYTGGIAGLAATNPAARGELKLDPSTAASQAYLAYLAQRHDAVRAAATQALGRPLTATFDYRYAFNGFASVLSEQEADKVAALPGVRGVQKSVTRELLTDAGPAWIGAPAIWDGSGTGGASGTKGEGVVVGVIDTGVNHDHPSFADVGGDGFDHTNPRGRFFGLCDPVLGAPFCNDKLIGVHDFTGTTFQDDNGHGSHTASTAAGNVLAATLNAPTMTVTRPISGVAPHANLITYKACIAAGCVGASLTAAIDQATADGVDVINYSIGGTANDPWSDADAQAFLGARDAGIFVATSAGNSGPRSETLGSPADAPWLLAVGASTHNRALFNSLVDMNGGATAPPADITGASLTSGVGPAPIVHAEDFGDRLCGAPFPPGTFDGEIVICERGVNPRVEKGRNVLLGGAGGMVLANSAADGESTIADPHELPAVHIAYSKAVVLEAWVRDGGNGHTARISGTTLDVAGTNGDVMAGFSSRGASPSVPDVLKPDVTAPGVNVLAAWMGVTPGGAEYNVISGTSMSSPHAAGAAALVRALRPNWTPAEVQSALMTTSLTAGVRKEDGVRAADPFDYGAGRIDLTQAGRAGLVLDESGADFAAADPSEGGDPTSLNLASLANSDCFGTCSWTRVLESTLSGSTTWTVKVTAPRNVKLTVSPAKFTVGPGATQSLTVSADVTKAPVGKWLFAELRLTANGASDLHLPVAIVPGGTKEVDIETPSSSGTQVVDVTTKVAIKDLQTASFGLVKGSITDHTVLQDPTPLDPYDGLGGTFHVTIDVAPGSKFLTAAVTETTATDLDLYVGIDSDGDGAPDESEEVCSSASEIALESCKLTNPDGGTYWVMVQDWLLGSVPDDVTLLVSTVPGTSSGNMTATGPKSAAANSTFPVTLTWNEPAMQPGETWFGLVELGSEKKRPNNVGALIVRIDRK